MKFIRKINSKYLIIWLVIFLGAYLFFYGPVNSFFSQDDFFHMSLVMDKNFSDIPKFFSSEPNGYYFYRPLSRETYNLFMYRIFGLNSWMFHLVNFLLILINGFLVYKFSKLLVKNKMAVLIAMVLYIFSSVHSIELYYLASFQNLLAGTFVLSGLIYYLKFLNRGVKKFWYLSILFFVLAMFSHESAAVFIILIFSLEMFVVRVNRKQFLKIFKHLFPFIFVLAIRFLIHYFGPGLDPQQTYQPSFGIKSILNTFSWFTLWSFGMPEMLVDFATLNLKFNPNLFKFYSYYTNSVFPLFLLIMLSLFLVIISLARKSWKDKNIWFLASGYVVSLIPFLVFPNHKFVYYLSIPILFFCSVVGLLLGKYWDFGKTHKFLIITFLAAYIVISHKTIDLNKITHWAAKRADSANFITEDLKERYSNLPKGTIFYIKNDPQYPFIAKEWGTSSKQAFYILSGPDAFKLIFKDSSIKAYYEDVTGPPKGNDANKLIVYEPHFPY